MVNISLRVLSRPDMVHIPQVHRELGQDFDEKVMCPDVPFHWANVTLCIFSSAGPTVHL